MNSVNYFRISHRLLFASACLASLAGAGAYAQTAQPAPTTPAKSDEEVVVLSPFEVNAGADKGYYGANTMSGTRVNTKLADLASSITVMTKGQMTDFAMLDINDIFRYVAGTEGTGTFTSYSLDRNGSIQDNVSMDPTQANRVRGLAPANVSLGNFETMGRVPIDPIEVESVEVSRGPNANVFGLGNASGTVNLVPTSANFTRNFASVTGRVDSFGGWRTSLDVNRTLLKDKLAVRVSGIFQHDGFKLKPSGVDTERYKAMVKYRPFKSTTITASISGYHAYGNRPNAIPPRDNLAYWIASGKPTWDPVTMTVHVNGTTLGPYTAASYNGPDYFNSGYLGNNHNQMFIDQGGLVYLGAPQITTSATNPSASLTGQHYLQTSAAAGPVFSGTAPRPFDQPLFNTTPTISDRSIYDWKSINLSAPNKFWDRTTTSLFQIDQFIIDTPNQTLAAQAAFFREDSDRWQRALLGTTNDNGQSGQLTVDINERLIDGTANPFFLRPYIVSDKPRTQENPQKWDATRGQLAYRLDLTKESNLLKWLGMFQVTGYGEYKYRLNRQYSWRDAISSTLPWVPFGTYRGTQSAPSGTPAVVNLTSGEYRYYVGDNSGNNVDYAPGDFSLGNYPFVWVSRAGAGTVASPFTYTTHSDSVLLSRVAADKSGGTLNTKTTLKTVGVVGQSHLIDDRLVTTLGWRNDGVWTKYGFLGQPTNAYLNADGTTFNYDAVNAWQGTYFKNGGHTTNVQFVLRPFMNLHFVEHLAQNGAGGQFLSELLNGLSFMANRSNSFLPTNPAQDLFRHMLPNTTGSDKSYGLGLSLFHDTLQIRATRYDDWSRDAQTSDISTVAGRVLRIDFAPTGTGNPTPFVNLNTNAQRWVKFENPTWSQSQIDAEVQKETGFSADDNAFYINPNPPIGATTDVRSYGTEVEINYNPTSYWTVAGSVTKTAAVNTNVSKALVNWIDDRMPIWTTVVDPSIATADAIAEGNPNKLWWNHHYSTTAGTNAPGLPASYSATAQTPAQNYNAFVYAPFAVMKALEGKSNPEVRPYTFIASTSLQLSGLFDNKYVKRTSIGGAVRWEDRGAIGYYGVQQLPAIITDLDTNRPIYDKSHTYVDLFAAYKMKLWSDKVGMTLQLNVRNVGQRAHLQPVGAFPDGTISTYRIVDPQQIIFTASFDL